MKDKLTPSNLVLISIVCGLLMITALFAGCTQSTNTAAVATTVPTEAATAMPTPVATTTTAIPTTMATTATPVPTYTPSNSNLVAFTAASLTGASGTIGLSLIHI